MTTQLILLGTSSPRIEPNKVQTSFLLKIDDKLYMIDAGSGAHERLIQACDRYGAGLQSTDLHHIFLTHLHPDHTVGLPPLMISPYVIGRKGPLHIYGPKGTRMMCDHILAAFDVGLHELEFHGPRDSGPVQLDVTEIDEGIVFQDERLTLEAIRVVHGNLEAFAFKAVTADKTIFFSGDTCPVDILVEKAKGCDILVHEAYYGPGMGAVPERWQAYFKRVHTSGFEVGQIGRQVAPKLLILNHQMIYGGFSDADLIQEVRDGGYTGELVSGQDLQLF